jgi:PadR family transcriptional regulator PadR
LIRRQLQRPCQSEDIFLFFASMPRRKPGTLVPLEREILSAAASMRSSGAGSFHGFGLAQALREHSGSRALTGHGTLYKALGRLEEFGLLVSHWEDAAAVEGRPRRRLYELTGKGAQVARTEDARHTRRPSPRVSSEPA